MAQSGTRRQAELLRRQGNKAYERQRFGGAIDLYTETLKYIYEDIKFSKIQQGRRQVVRGGVS
ncbi:hypothetical protein QJS10_CPA02g00910 [Acorus calamus]|uniref:Uncharacterized protein n=1 Tax=Acorus calamus TaxID=4465 RepID=A0AAV9FD96_ACOCL|nr:hypothetical protein QJS10_CPA02g00910 [Acorus calamus]